MGVYLCTLESNLGLGKIGLGMAEWVRCRCKSLPAGIEPGTRPNRVMNGDPLGVNLRPRTKRVMNGTGVAVGVNLCTLESNLGPPGQTGL